PGRTDRGRPGREIGLEIAVAGLRRWRLAGHRDPENRRRDLVADEGSQFLVEAERLLLELVQRILLGVASKPDPTAHVVELGDVLDPERINRSQEHQSLDQRPIALADLSALRF